MNDPVMIDTAAAYALVSENDSFHVAAQAIFQRLRTGGSQVFITNYALVEFQALAFRRLPFEPVRNFVEAARNNFNIQWIDTDTHWAGWELMIARWPRLSLVDATTVLVARQLGCAVFTFDEDFRQEGLTVIP